MIPEWAPKSGGQPPRRRGRKLNTVSSKKLRMLELIRRGSTDRGAAAEVGISETTFYRWQREDPGFMAVCSRARLRGRQDALDQIRKMDVHAWLRLVAPEEYSPRFRVERDVTVVVKMISEKLVRILDAKLVDPRLKDEVLLALGAPEEGTG